MRQSNMLLELGGDLALRDTWYCPASRSHPAKLHLGLVEWLVQRSTRSGHAIAHPMVCIHCIRSRGDKP